MKIKFDYIDSDEKLIEFTRKIESTKWLAVDTEFMRERTYYAKLALIQIAAEGANALIDVPAINNLAPLQAVFVRADCLKIMHSASQDLEVLYQVLGQMPTPLFDTQIAASFLGEADQIAYGAIVEQRLGIKLDKDQTRTNWLQRPLSAAQIGYAQADVLYLYELYQQLVCELDQNGRLDWVNLESQALTEKTLNGFAPELAWQRIKGLARLTSGQRQAAIALATWREKRAQSRDLPREWVMKKQVLTALAKYKPESMNALRNIEGMNDKMIQYMGKHLLKVIAAPASDAPQTMIFSELDAEQRAQAKKLMTWLKRHGEKLKIAPALIANRSSIEQLVLGQRDLPLLKGWRAQIAGDALLEMLSS